MKDDRAGLRGYVQFNKYIHTYIHTYIHIHTHILLYIMMTGEEVELLIMYCITRPSV